ncbi:ACT domain-containing protein [Gongronella butleri]|nr:ACT domain-containing protein [Gongronella butleri]
MSASTIQLKLLQDPFSVCQLPTGSAIPTKVLEQPWFTVSKTPTELSFVLPTEGAKGLAFDKQEDGWRAMMVDAQMDFGLVGILARIVSPLRDNAIPVFVVSTFDTDYVLVKQDTVEQAQNILNAQDAIVVTSGPKLIA